MKPKLLLWGASGHAMVVADIIQLRDEYDIIGYLDDVTDARGENDFLGAPIFRGRDSLVTLYRQGVRHAIVAFGNCSARLEVAGHIKAQGFELVTAVHPSAIVARDVLIGEGTVIAAGAVINPGVRIGTNVIINTTASIDHESIIKDGAHACPGVHLAGRVTVGEATWIGIGSTVIDGVRIGAGSFIGAGSVVVRDIPDNSLAFGVPAKIREKIK